MGAWVIKTLGEITSYITKGIPPQYTNEDTKDTIRVLNQKCNRDFRISYDEARWHDNAIKKVPNEKMLRSGDILINSTGAGTAGRIAQIWEIPTPTTLDGHMILMRPTEEIDPLYYGYAIKGLQSTIETYAEGSTGQTEINKTRLQNETIIRFPEDKLEQRKIGSILLNIDEKIHVNECINQNLEQQAIMLFQSWFIDFTLSKSTAYKESEFGRIPNDFTVCKIGNLPIIVTDYVANGSFASLKENVTLYQEPNYAYFIRNTDLKSGSFNTFVDRHSYEFLSKSSLYGEEIIISNVGDVGSVFLCPKLDRPMTLGNNVIMIRPNDERLRYFIYIWFKYEQGKAIIQGIKGGSAQPKFNKTDFKNTSILLPTSDLLSLYNETVTPLFKTIAQNQVESSYLINLRDTLLPKLMSGEIDVSAVNI